MNSFVNKIKWQFEEMGFLYLVGLFIFFLAMLTAYLIRQSGS